MYNVGVFLNGRAEKVRKSRMFTQPALQRIWQEEPYSLNLEGVLSMSEQCLSLC